jgi:hypothetical protein
MKKPHMEEESKPPSCISTENDEPPGKETNSSFDTEACLCEHRSDRISVRFVRSILDGCSELLASGIVHWDQPHPRLRHKLPILAFDRD